MNFHSPEYAVFLCAVFAAYWAVARFPVARTALLLGASYFFYACWNERYLLLIAASTLIDYWAARAIAAAPPERSGRRKALLGVSVASNLGVLATFKYYGFFRDTVEAWLGWQAPLLDVLLPVGISFYTFQGLSYTIDVYRGAIPPARNLREFALFLAFFPQLVAGPIVRAREFLPQLEREPRLARRGVHEGLWRIMVGLGKKVLIADVLATGLVDGVYASGSPAQGLWVLLAIYAFCLQLYGDFSGYSDIAIGSAMLLGFVLPENFDAPYRARSMREFWLRWHITLSTWVRDYVYSPLAGPQRSGWRAYASLWLTMALVGLWHGAHWNMVFFGMLHGTFLVVNRAWARRGSALFQSPAGRAAAWILTFHCTAASTVLFRTTSLTHADDLLGRLAAPTQGAALTFAVALAFLAGIATQAAPGRWQLALKERFCALPSVLVGASVPVFLGLLAAAGSRGLPFIYFQF